MKLQTELAPRHKSGLQLKNPVILASGTFGYGIENTRFAEVQRLGAIISKGTTLHTRKGNQQPRIVETPSGMLNAIGLQNPGVHTVVTKYAPLWAMWDTPVLVNIAGEDIEEFVSIAEQLEGVAGIAGIEVNVSCPNVRAGGAVFGADPQAVSDVTSALRIATTLPLIVKLSPNTGDVRPTAVAAVEAGADAVSLINTITGMSIDIHTRKHTLANKTGGLSGPAIKPIALRMLFEVAQMFRTAHRAVPILGLGGICNSNDALEFLMAGASAIEIGTANFGNPRVGVEIVEGIEDFLEREGIEDIQELIGVALS